MVTPYLKPFNISGGSLYVFPSASKDLTRTMVSNDYEFKFSHFACLNLPAIDLEDNTSGSDKKIHLGTFGYIPGEDTTNAYSDALVEHLQNYVMNFETAILNSEGDNDYYDNEILTSVSEKVFFNWLQKVGAIKFNGNIEDYDYLKDRTVQYLGNIDVINTVEIGGDSFEELYLLIPGDAGYTPEVYFRDGSATDNKNYLDKEYVIDAKYASTLIGRTSGDTTYGLSGEPIFDDKANLIYSGDSGHTIDFRDASYDGGISNVNAGSKADDFDFNAVLIYYDLYSATSTPNVKRISTNLYGILFINGISHNSESDNYIIKTYPKVKETTNSGGNSFGLKIDLKIDTTPDTDATRITSYKDPNDVEAMAIYEKSLVKLQQCIDFFYEQNSTISDLRERVNTLETLVTDIDKISSLKDDIDRLYDIYNGNQAVDNESILSLIEVNSNKLDTIMNGGKNIQLQYDTDVLQAGTGVTLDKSLNKVVINAGMGYAIDDLYSDSNYTYKITETDSLDPSNAPANCYMKLKSGENLGVLYLDDAGDYSTVINIYIDDSESSWTVGQSLKLYLKSTGDDTTLNLEDSYGINIYNCTNIPSYEISAEELEDIRLIEIVCVADDEFVYLLTK